MTKVHITATVDHLQLAQTIRMAPNILSSAVPVVSFKCGPFECSTIEDVWAIAKEMVAQERQASYDLLRAFGP